MRRVLDGHVIRPTEVDSRVMKTNCYAFNFLGYVLMLHPGPMSRSRDACDEGKLKDEDSLKSATRNYQMHQNNKSKRHHK